MASAEAPVRTGGKAGAAAVPVGIVLLIAWTWACLWFPLTDSDIWWHLAAGDWIERHQAVPRVDPFATSSLGRPWIDLHWGFQLLASALWSAGGAAALVGGKCLALSAALLLALGPHLRPATAWLLLPMAGLGIYANRYFLDVRPLAITLAGLALLHAAAMAHLRGRLRHPWAVILPVQVALANVQGLYPLGAFTITCLWAGEAWDRRSRGVPPEGPSLKPLGWTCLGTWLAGFATPYGLEGFLLPLTLLLRITPLPGNVFSAEIAENQPLHALVLRDPSAAAPHVLILLAAWWTFDRARGRASAGHGLLLAGFAVLGAMAQRNLPLLLLAGLASAGRNLHATVPPGIPTRRAWAGPLALSLIALAAGPSIREAWDYELPGSLVTPFRFPGAAADSLRARPVEGAMFNELRFGGYLAFRLHPDQLPFVDGRMILRDADFYRGFLAVVDDPRGFPAYARERGFRQALLPVGEDRRFMPLAAYLVREESWDLLLCDGAAAWLAAPGAADRGLKGPEGLAAMRKALHARFGANPRLEAIAQGNLEDFLRAAGWPGL